MKLVVGLGNPAARYKKTRHNVGFRVIDRFSKVSGIKLSYQKHFSVFGKGQIGSERVVLAKPLTYVNLSGKAVKSFMHYYRIGVQDLLLIYDDMDLKLGRIRVRPGGGSGGHKGVESTILHLGSDRFPRIRVGIGRRESESVTGRDFVLEELSRDEEPIIEEAISESAGAIETVISEGLDVAMNKFNKK